MPINTLETSTIFMTALDEQLIEGATSGWMEANAGQVVYNGGNEVKIPKMSVNGLANYDRDAGYKQGAISMVYETRTMTQDRGRRFLLDAIAVNETNFVANATAVMNTFQREQIIPEVDAYRYSAIYSQLAAAGYSKSYTPAASTILSSLNNDITAVQDTCGAADLVIVMPYTVADILDSTDKLNRHINAGDFKQGKVDLKVKTYNGIPIIRVPSARMKTEYIFNDGETAGQTEGGFTPTDGAVQINWIICPKTAPIAISKTDNFKIIDPAANQTADAWMIMYRKFHDLWIKDKAKEAMRVCIAS